MEDQNVIKLSLVFVALVLSTCIWPDADVSMMFVSDRTVDERFSQSQVWNADHPKRDILIDQDDYTLYCAADSHVGGTVNLNKFFSAAITDQCAAVVMVGDLCIGKAEDYQTLASVIPAPTKLTSYLIAGNHDLYFSGWGEFYNRFGSTSYIFTVTTPNATDLYICLDTGGGTLGESQLAWFESILKNDRPNFRRCVVFTHNNLFRIRRTFSTNPQIEEVLLLSELCVRYSVDAVITGHDHQRNVQQFGNTLHITMDALLDGLSYASYFRLRVMDGNISYVFTEM